MRPIQRQSNLKITLSLILGLAALSTPTQASRWNVAYTSADEISTITLSEANPSSEPIELFVHQSLSGEDYDMHGQRGVQLMLIPLNLDRDDFSSASTCRPVVKAQFSFDGRTFGDIGRADVTFGGAINPRATYAKLVLDKSCGLAPKYQMARVAVEHAGVSKDEVPDGNIYETRVTKSVHSVFTTFGDRSRITLSDSSPTGPTFNLRYTVNTRDGDVANVQRPYVVISLNNYTTDGVRDPNRCRPSVVVEYSLDGEQFGAMDTTITFGGIIPAHTKFARLRARRTCGSELSFVASDQTNSNYWIDLDRDFAPIFGGAN